MEWPEAGLDGLPDARATVTLEHVTPTSRNLRIDAVDTALLQGLDE